MVLHLKDCQIGYWYRLGHDDLTVRGIILEGGVIAVSDVTHVPDPAFSGMPIA